MHSELSPPYIQNFSFESLTHEQFLIIIIEAASKLNWNIGPVSEYGFIAYRKQSKSFSSEELTVDIGNEYADLTSRYTGIQIVDEFKNKENIDNLIAPLHRIKN